VARVYDRVLVLGLAPDRVSLLSELGEDDAIPQSQEWTARLNPKNTPGASPAFRSLLKKLVSKPAAPPQREVSVPPAPRRASPAAPARRMTIAELDALERQGALAHGESR
jgi:hypothetical protein